MNDFERWADFYEYLYAEKFEERGDKEFYRELLDECAEPALEVACGTGRLTIPFLEAGHDVHGVDISEGMLDRLQAEADGLDPTLFHGDAAEVEYPTEYGLVYLPFSAVMHFNTVEHLRRLFHNVADHLQDGGAFALDVVVPDFDTVANEYEKVTVEEFERDGRTHHWETWAELTDRVEQETIMHNRVVDVEQGRIRWETEFELALMPKRQLELLFAEAGFSEWEFYDAFTGEALDEETEQMAGVGWM